MAKAGISPRAGSSNGPGGYGMGASGTKEKTTGSLAGMAAAIEQAGATEREGFRSPTGSVGPMPAQGPAADALTPGRRVSTHVDKTADKDPFGSAKGGGPGAERRAHGGFRKHQEHRR